MKQEQARKPLVATRQQGVSLVVVLLIILIVLVVSLGTAAGLYVAGVFDVAPAQADGNKPVKLKPPIYVPLEPALVVNLDRNGRLGFLQVTAEAMTRTPAVEEALLRHSPVIRNNLLMLLSGKTYAEIASREGKEALRQEALEEVNRILSAQSVAGEVEDLYFTGFVMQ